MNGDGDLPTGKIVLAVADSASAATQLERIGAAVGVHIMTATLAQAPTRLATIAAPTAVVIDAGEVSAESEDALLKLVEACHVDGVNAIVLLGRTQLDAIGGMLVGDRAELLCDPEEAEIAAALAMAVADAGGPVRDLSGETARRQRIQEEVARFAATLTRIVDRTDAAPAGITAELPFVAERSAGFGVQEIAIDPAEVRRAIRARRLRDDMFAHPGLFEDPAWDMLLDLFAAELERRRVSVSSLCIAAAVAPTTALRWIGKLIDANLLERQPDAFDRRRAFISLSARASAAMHSYVAALQRAGLALA